MKIGLPLVMLCLLLPSYVQAVPESPNDSALVEEMAEIAFCTANEIVLMQHRLQVGATMTAQTDNNPQLTALAESFVKMAMTNRDQIGTYILVMKQAIAPEIASHFEGLKEDDVLDKANTLTTSALEAINTLTNRTQPLEKQVAMERKLIDKATMCESLATTIQKRHTM